MNRKRLLSIIGCMGCATTTFAVLIIAAVVWLLATTDPMYRADTPDLWYELPGNTFVPHEDSCKTGWNEAAPPKPWTCEELSNPPSTSTNVATRAAVYVDSSLTTEFVHLRLEQYSPRMAEADSSTVRALTWPEVIEEDLDLDDCQPHYVPYFDSGIWKCDDAVYAHTGVHIHGESTDRAAPGQAHLWIGRNVEDLEAPFHEQGRLELDWLADQHSEEVAHYLDAEDMASADFHFSNAALAIVLIPEEERTEEQRDLLDAAHTLREAVQEVAHQQRQARQLPMPLPAHRGYVHLAALVEQPPTIIETLLGPPKDCESRESTIVCTYGDIWHAEITFVGAISNHVTLSLRGVDDSILFEKGSLRKFDLPVLPPSDQSRDRLRWEQFDEVGLVEFLRHRDGTLDYVEIRAD